MKAYDWIDSFCLSFDGAEREIKPDWNAVSYQVGKKIFLLQGENPEGKAIVTVKLEPARGELFRNRYEEVFAGYYMNKVHWNSVDLGGNLPEAVLKEMISESYRIILESLPKKTQAAILGKAQ
ncbi:MAG: MmcQ/YjbR family DNA-binding protein [Anaerolineaceae bacterium]|nr:MmcQ/YjbR family DNA-binding protein [Anaerolineaceae bacterium]